ncbi:MAG: hypothetical protein QXP04_03930 [Candidatus Nanoarchaeia archaeon]|nr:hypothetical protein [Candidatus Jingweiarchaeum tengchongense]
MADKISKAKAETRKAEFTAIVRYQKSAFQTNSERYGRISSIHLGPFIGKRVKVIIEEQKV